MVLTSGECALAVEPLVVLKTLESLSIPRETKSSQPSEPMVTSTSLVMDMEEWAV